MVDNIIFQCLIINIHHHVILTASPSLLKQASLQIVVNSLLKFYLVRG